MWTTNRERLSLHVNFQLLEFRKGKETDVLDIIVDTPIFQAHVAKGNIFKVGEEPVYHEEEKPKIEEEKPKKTKNIQVGDDSGHDGLAVK